MLKGHFFVLQKLTHICGPNIGLSAIEAKVAYVLTYLLTYEHTSSNLPFRCLDTNQIFSESLLHPLSTSDKASVSVGKVMAMMRKTIVMLLL